MLISIETISQLQIKKVETHFSELPDLQEIKTYTNPT